MSGEANLPKIRSASEADAGTVAGILREAASWLDAAGHSLWRIEEFQDERVAREIGEYFLAEIDGEPAGMLRFQLEDSLFWPDVPTNDSAFVHRLAVRRNFAGGEFSKVLLEWAVERTRSLGRKFLRLDCDASRPRLRAIYERFGFRYHNERRVGSFLAARYEYKA